MTESPGSVLCLDLGEKRIGIAISDPNRIVAAARKPLPAGGRRANADAVAALACAEDVAMILVGLPISMSGEEGPQAIRARRFGDELRSRCDIEIVFWDERLSTAEAHRYLREGNVRRERRRELVDSMSASIVLQSFLDAQRRPTQ